MATEQSRAIKVFFSYAHEDKKLREKLDKHLGALKRSGLIVTWYDHDIQAGMPLEDEINLHLNTADLILLLISDDFISSDYCYSQEMLRALERHDLGETRVIPIILSPVFLEDTPISKLAALPAEGKPITAWRNRDAAFMQVAQGIYQVVKTLLKQQDVKDRAVQKQRQQTIDTHEALGLFQQLMQADTEHQFRIMYLVGEANMGKSHLLTKVFPMLAHNDYNARCITLDLRNPLYAVSEILNMASAQLGAEYCSNYQKTLQEMAHQTTGTGDLTRVLANFASFTTPGSFSNDTQVREERLTTQLVLDLSKLNDKPLVLFFDTLNQATDQIQHWLIKTFLAKLSLLPHVRIVAASRRLTEVPGDYMDLLQVHQLGPVQDEEEYIVYCQGLNASLKEQEIRSRARDCDYTPGLFASLFASLVPQGT